VSTVGALLAAIALGSLVLAIRTPSAVGRRLQQLAPDPNRDRSRLRPTSARDLRHAGIALTPDGFLVVKVAASATGVLLIATLSLFLSLGPAVVLLGGYAGWIAPSLLVASRAGSARTSAQRATIVLVERLDALVATGRPAETALARVLERPTGAALLDQALRRVREAYVLGAPLFRTLAHHAREEGLDSCASLAEDLERSRDLGTASAAILRERRAALRAVERSRALDAASKVEGRLMLVLALCYLPALMLLVVIPLFMSLLDGLAV
jgi:tight adherence protein C